ncbi:hypothetical protein OIU84_021589 [Salix udensis]|uniref:Uncharacterized protein n=1 Tax=Salix udensis TaxID=889485 RepID=A0AAD6PH88_9ROSI|nr:hypothetical protein OIU84_021589 [Salix udensis]
MAPCPTNSSYDQRVSTNQNYKNIPAHRKGSKFIEEERTQPYILHKDECESSDLKQPWEAQIEMEERASKDDAIEALKPGVKTEEEEVLEIIRGKTLGEDMAFDILSRLPRFMCACKAWLGQIENPSFITDHYNKALKSYFRSSDIWREIPDDRAAIELARRACSAIIMDCFYEVNSHLRSRYQPDQINFNAKLGCHSGALRRGESFRSGKMIGNRGSNEIWSFV